MSGGTVDGVIGDGLSGAVCSDAIDDRTSKSPEPSLYNIVAQDQDGDFVIYNTLKRGLAVLSPEAYEGYQRPHGPYAPELYRLGFLVDDASYEQRIQEEAFDRDRMTSDWFALCIAPTYECNYACPYCYEHGYNPAGFISHESIEGIFAFFERVYARDRFEKFSLSWYGGEPTLCIDVIERMTARFRAFCDEHGIDFTIAILSNCGAIDETLAARLAACGVEHMMPTIDGLPELHNKRRVNRNGSDAFANTVRGAHCCHEAGIDVRANMNADRINMRQFKELRKLLHDEHGIPLYPSLLKDYRQDFGRNDTGFCAPAFDLYTREDYAHDLHDLFAETPYTREVLEGLLTPVRDFCRGQLENYWVIDSKGDVYKCDGWLGQKDHAYFNVRDLPNVDTLYVTDYNPLRDPVCRDCEVMPLCKGQCEWDRALLEQVCHVAKFTIADYVRDYRSCFGARTEPVTSFVPNTAPGFYLEKPFECDGPNESRWAGTPYYETDEEGNATYSKGKPFKDLERKMSARRMRKARAS